MSRPSCRRLAVLTLTLVLASGVVLPALAEGQKIAIVDTERVIVASATGRQALEALTALREEKQREAEALEKDLQEVQARLQEGRMSLSEDRLAELQRQVEDKMLAMRRFQDDANRQLTARRDEVLAQVDAKVMPVINRYAEANGYDLIFRKFESGLIYAADAIDITDEVIAALDSGSQGG